MCNHAQDIPSFQVSFDTNYSHPGDSRGDMVSPLIFSIAVLAGITV